MNPGLQAAFPVAPLPLGHFSSAASQQQQQLPLASNTLFLANLGGRVEEQELQSLLASFPGFRQMKVLRRGPDQTIAFAEFVTIECAAAASTELRGSMLASSRLPMRVEYSHKPWQ